MRFILPLLLFAALVVLLAIGLTKDPRIVPSPLIGKPLPEFSLPLLSEPNAMVSSDVFQGQVSLLNVWASWCISCRVEHPLLMEIADQVPIYGLNYKDTPTDAKRWLAELGNPYRMNAVDQAGQVALDLGVYGAPETYIIDKNGLIAYKHIGPITWQDWQQTLWPIITSLQ